MPGREFIHRLMADEQMASAPTLKTSRSDSENHPLTKIENERKQSRAQSGDCSFLISVLFPFALPLALALGWRAATSQHAAEERKKKQASSRDGGIGLAPGTGRSEFLGWSRFLFFHLLGATLLYQPRPFSSFFDVAFPSFCRVSATCLVHPVILLLHFPLLFETDSQPTNPAMSLDQ